jgi:hypothetical protein
MILVPVALAFGLICLLKCTTASQQIWTMLTTAGGVAVICAAVAYGDPMGVVFSVIGYMLLVVIGQTISAAISRRRAALKLATQPLTAPAPASTKLFVVLGVLILAGLGFMAASGDRHAAFGLIGLAIGCGLTLLVRALSRPKQ